MRFPAIASIILSTLILAGYAHLSEAAVISKLPPPNILFIIMDDVGIDQMKSFGYGGKTAAAMPIINQVAQSGIRFRNNWSMPACSPSRAVFFEGRFPGYQACDSVYHDFAHTNVACVAVTRILDGHLKSGEEPHITARDFELTIAAILLHDTGYIKKTGDHEGTGAKYTLVHPNRSVEFAHVLLAQLGVAPDEICKVQAAIRYAGLEDAHDDPAFSAHDRFIGCVVGSGDILGQMADPAYPERLPGLYDEFHEAKLFAGLDSTGIGSYQSATDLMRRTREFYETYVQRMLTTRWGRVHEVLRYHFADGRNQYLDAIALNLDKIDRLTRS